MEELDDRLSDAEHLPAYADAPVEAAIARLRGELGLEPGVAAARRRSAAGAAPPFIPIVVRFVDADPDMELSADPHPSPWSGSG